MFVPPSELPWEDRPAGDNKSVLWRYSSNPVVPRDATPTSNSVFNSAVVRFKDRFAGVFRVDNTCVQMRLHAASSRDGIAWSVAPEPIVWQRPVGAEAHLLQGDPISDYGYDPRVVKMEDDPADDRFFVVWCNGNHGPCIGLGFTRDFETFYQIEAPLMPCNRNGVLLPRKIGGRYALLSRPSDNGHTKFGDIWVSFSPDLIHWGSHRFVMAPTPFELSAWQCTKIGAGCVPIHSVHGWLLFYHGVITTCSGCRYAIGAAILDPQNPTKVLHRTQAFLLTPHPEYERSGDVPIVCLPVSALTDGERVAIYYGAADTVVALCFGVIEEIVAFVKKNDCA